MVGPRVSETYVSRIHCIYASACVHITVFITYLGNESSQKGHDRRVVAKLPNEHHHLFHGHLVARALAQHIIHQTAAVDLPTKETNQKRAQQTKIPVRSDTAVKRGIFVGIDTSRALLARLRATRTRVIPSYAHTRHAVFHLPILEGFVLFLLGRQLSSGRSRWRHAFAGR
jgi:hypothetical protein